MTTLNDPVVTSCQKAGRRGTSAALTVLHPSMVAVLRQRRVPARPPVPVASEGASTKDTVIYGTRSIDLKSTGIEVTTTLPTTSGTITKVVAAVEDIETPRPRVPVTKKKRSRRGAEVWTVG